MRIEKLEIMEGRSWENELGEIKKGSWKAEEDEVLINHLNKCSQRSKCGIAAQSWRDGATEDRGFEEVLIEANEDLEGLEAKIGAEFEAIRSREANAHVVPSHVALDVIADPNGDACYNAELTALGTTDEHLKFIMPSEAEPPICAINLIGTTSFEYPSMLLAGWFNDQKDVIFRKCPDNYVLTFAPDRLQYNKYFIAAWKLNAFIPHPSPACSTETSLEAEAAIHSHPEAEAEAHSRSEISISAVVSHPTSRSVTETSSDDDFFRSSPSSQPYLAASPLSCISVASQQQHLTAALASGHTAQP
nr:SWI/SNF complex subunit SWI3D-like [Ipomoea batatas]